MGKPRSLTEEEKQILIRNGIDPEHKSVTLRTDGAIYLIHHPTRDEICIFQGDRKWESY